MTDTLPVISNDTAADSVAAFELDQRRAQAYAASGYWPDAADIAKALVKIEAGRALGLPPIVAMSEVHVIEGKPTLGAGALAALVKTSGRYDYRVVDLTDQRCVLRFYDTRSGEVLGLSTFTMQDAETAKLRNRGPWTQYPRNMLFARAISNGVAWYCPDVTAGRAYTPDELEASFDPGEADADAEPVLDVPNVELDSLEEYEAEQELEQEQEPPDRLVDDPEAVYRPAREEQPTPAQTARIKALIHDLTESRPDVNWKLEARHIAGVPGEMLTRGAAAMVIRKLEEQLPGQE